MNRITMTLLLLGLSMSAAAQEFDYDAYKPATLSQVTTSLPAHTADWFADGHPRFRTRAIFTGRVRQASKELKDFIVCWVEAKGHPVAYAGIFQQEIEISQDGVEYWTPIEDVLLEPLQAEVPPGAPVDLYLLLMGGQRDQAIFAISEFDAVGDTHVPPPRTN